MGSFLSHGWLHQSYIYLRMSVKTLLLDRVIFDAKGVCDYLMYKIASVREGEEWKDNFVFQKLKLSLALPSQTPMGFLGHCMKHTVTMISQQKDTLKETNTNLIASIVNWQAKGEQRAQVFPFILFF